MKKWKRVNNYRNFLELSNSFKIPCDIKDFITSFKRDFRIFDITSVDIPNSVLEKIYNDMKEGNNYGIVHRIKQEFWESI